MAKEKRTESPFFRYTPFAKRLRYPNRADLILLNSNPLESIPFYDKIEGVLSGGVYHSREEHHELLNEIQERM